MAVRAQTHKLGRKRDQRRALLGSLTESLVQNESIVTTDAKARALRPHVEKLITKAKEDTQSRRRLIRSRVKTDDTAAKLFNELAPRYKDRPGGYTRLEAAGYRRGDNAKLTRISFVIDTDEVETQVNESQVETDDGSNDSIEPAEMDDTKPEEKTS